MLFESFLHLFLILLVLSQSLAFFPPFREEYFNNSGAKSNNKIQSYKADKFDLPKHF
jgi:hypothetical protein